MKYNFIILGLASAIPILVGFIWFNPRLFGKAWMESSGLTEEKIKGNNMGRTLSLTLAFSFFIAFSLQYMVIHQFHLFSMLLSEPGIKEPGSAIYELYKDLMVRFGDNFRTFKHGAFHGLIAGVTLAFPLIAINALFEMKSFKYIFINSGYWTLSLILMGGLICAYA